MAVDSMERATTESSADPVKVDESDDGPRGSADSCLEEEHFTRSTIKAVMKKSLSKHSNHLSGASLNNIKHSRKTVCRRTDHKDDVFRLSHTQQEEETNVEAEGISSTHPRTKRHRRVRISFRFASGDI